MHTTLELPDMVSDMELLTNCPELPGLKSLGQKMVTFFSLKKCHLRHSQKHLVTLSEQNNKMTEGLLYLSIGIISN